MPGNVTATPLILGGEIGGTKLQLALGDLHGEILAAHRGAAPVEKGASGILDWFEAEIPDLFEQAREIGGEIRAIGVGFGGPVDSATGRALQSFQVKGWENVALKHWFEAQYRLPVVVENDSNAAGWAEYCLGAGRGTRCFFYTNIGSGIGGALIVDGELHNGQGFGAGEMGHTWVPDWTAPSPGTADKLENLCSGWSIERRLRAIETLPKGSPLERLCAGHPAAITCAMLGRAAAEGDAFALEELDRITERIGLAIANVLALFHPERIALGGGVPLMGDVFLDPLRRHVERYCFEPYRGHYAIVPCELGESVVIAGAILRAAERMGA